MICTVFGFAVVIAIGFPLEVTATPIATAPMTRSATPPISKYWRRFTACAGRIGLVAMIAALPDDKHIGGCARGEILVLHGDADDAVLEELRLRQHQG